MNLLLVLVPVFLGLAAPAFAGGMQPRRFEPNLPPPPMKSQPITRLPGVIVPGRAVQGPNCRSRCASQCSFVSCSGLNVSQCARARQDCRVTCTSRC